MSTETREAQTMFSMRLPEYVLAKFRTRHAETFVVHRLTFGKWVVAQIEQGIIHTENCPK